jgi:DNA recombination protein RmuC
MPSSRVLALFDQDNASVAEVTEARKAFERVMKEQGKRVKGYIQPENGTTDIALLYLPSETLYMETVRNRELWEELAKIKVLPVSPNTLLVTLQAISMVHKWYQLEKNLAKTIEEFGRARKSFEYFESKFEVIGKSLEKAQDAFITASGHLSRYKGKITNLGEQAQPELGFEEENGTGKDLAANA